MNGDYDQDLTQITPEIYLSGLRPAQELQLLKLHSITHIVAVGLQLQPSFPKQVAYKIVDLEDAPHSNILRHLPDTFRFIDDAVKTGGRVLVHCIAGVSRSATVTIAYLMKSERCSLAEAMKRVKSARPSICPNAGFMRQLKLYEEMSCELVMDNQSYREFLRNELARERTGRSIVDLTTAISELSQIPAQHTPAGTIPAVVQNIQYLRCRKCRLLLASKANIVQHDIGAGQAAFGYRKRNISAEAPICTSYYIEPMEWIPGVREGGLEDKIVCPSPKCGAKLGAWSWAGAPCSCGTWISPSFAIHRNKVDEVK